VALPQRGEIQRKASGSSMRRGAASALRRFAAMQQCQYSGMRTCWCRAARGATVPPSHQSGVCRVAQRDQRVQARLRQVCTDSVGRRDSYMSLNIAKERDIHSVPTVLHAAICSDGNPAQFYRDGVIMKIVLAQVAGGRVPGVRLLQASAMTTERTLYAAVLRGC